MKRRKSLIAGITVLAILVLAYGGYNIYRYPAALRRLSDNSLDDLQVEKQREETLSLANRKVLVAYFSYSGTTRNIANAISEKTGGDLFEITTQSGYSNVYRESNREIRGNERPALTGTVENMEEYDIVFVGYPVWWHATPAPVNTFLESYDLRGKLIIPFCTSGGSDIDETMPTFLNSCDGLAVYGERRIRGLDQLDGWLEELGLNGRAEETDITESISTVREEVQAEEVIEETIAEEVYVDSGNVFLFGASQGGLVSGITAAANREEIQGLILLYPGFEIVEDVQALFASAEDIPETYSMFGWMEVGRTYFEDLLDYDVYSVIGAYDKDVLLIHGDADGIVPISSSERALEVYPSAELKVLPGAGHGLHGQDAETATEYMLEYLQAHCS